jgi:hypothetical protein
MVVLVIAIGGCDPPDDPEEGSAAGECTDRIDNDEDGRRDCADIGCAMDPACAVVGEGEVAGECTDGVDNDADGFADCGDFGCVADPACADAGGG